MVTKPRQGERVGAGGPRLSALRQAVEREPSDGAVLRPDLSVAGVEAIGLTSRPLGTLTPMARMDGLHKSALAA